MWESGLPGDARRDRPAIGARDRDQSTARPRKDAVSIMQPIPARQPDSQNMAMVWVLALGFSEDTSITFISL